MGPYSSSLTRETIAREDEGEQTAFTAGLSYFPDYGFAPMPMGDIAADVGGLFGTAVAGPAGGVTVGAATNFIEGLFGGAAVDHQRAERVQYFLNQAMQGNVAAAQLILGAPSNVSGNERGMWTAAVQALQSSPTGSATLAQARSGGPVWFQGSGDTATNYPVMKNFTAQWGMSNAPLTTAVQGVINTATGLAGGKPLALNPSLTPILLLGVGGIVAYAAFSRKRRRRA